MSKPWIRLYTDVPNNPKVQRLAPALFKFWINCLCLYGKCGYLPSVSDISWILKIPEKQVEGKLKELVQAELLDETGTPHDWDDLQFESDLSRGRVKKFRDRHKKQPCNVTLTAQEQSRTDTETEQSRAEPPDPPDSYLAEFTAAICGMGFRNPENDTVTAYNTALIAEACEQAGATPKLGAWVAADLMKAQRFRDKPLEYLLGALRSQLAQNGPNRKALSRRLRHEP